METAQKIATKEATKFILVRVARAMQSDLKFGNYSDETMQRIKAELKDVKSRLNKLNLELSVFKHKNHEN